MMKMFNKVPSGTSICQCGGLSKPTLSVISIFLLCSSKILKINTVHLAMISVAILLPLPFAPSCQLKYRFLLTILPAMAEEYVIQSSSDLARTSRLSSLIVTAVQNVHRPYGMKKQVVFFFGFLILSVNAYFQLKNAQLLNCFFSGQAFKLKNVTKFLTKIHSSTPTI